MNKSTVYSPDYATARLRFRQAANRLGWTLEPHAIGRLGPDGMPALRQSIAAGQ